MSTNGTPPPKTRAKLREARARVALRRAELEERLLENFGFWTSPWSPSPFDGAPGGGQQWIPLGPQAGLGGRLGDRQDGSEKPFVWNDVDLVRSRSIGRWLAASSMLAQGAVECLADYTVRTGFDYEGRPVEGFREDAAARDLARQVQRVVEETQSLNTLGADEGHEAAWADRERETVLRSVVDGEVAVRTFDQGDGATLIRFVEPEQIQQPLGAPPEYRWGILTPEGDVEKHLAYAVVYDREDDWDDVPAGEFSFLKANTPSTVKRGLSDFYTTGQALHEVEKLLRAMRISGTAQASLAWIEQHSGANQAGLDALVAKSRNLAGGGPFTDPVSGRDVSGQTVQPGQRLLVGGGREFLPPPAPAGASIHIQIVQACLRAVGARWRMPEYLISGDASNANYASTLVAGSPFVTRVECRQAVYGRFFTRVLWQAVRNAARAGRFRYGGRVYAFAELCRLVHIEPTPPQVAIADKAAEEKADQDAVAGGVMSKATRRARMGLDDETERRHLERERQEAQAQAPAPTPGKEGQPSAGPFFPPRRPAA